MLIQQVLSFRGDTASCRNDQRKWVGVIQAEGANNLNQISWLFLKRDENRKNIASRWYVIPETPSVTAIIQFAFPELDSEI